MSWNSFNDPWVKSSKMKGKYVDHKVEMNSGKMERTELRAEELNIDPKALFIGEAFLKVIAKESTNRQCAAAEVSALFHLVYGMKTDSEVGRSSIQHAQSELDPNQTVVTAQLAQDAIAKHLDRLQGKSCKTLADGLRLMRKFLPSSLVKKLNDLNAAGSYDRHHGATLNHGLLAELSTALDAIEHPDSSAALGKNDHVEDVCGTTHGTENDDDKFEATVATEITNHLQVESFEDMEYAFTAHEPVRLDTGTDYIKLPLSTYVKVRRNIDGKAEVDRIGNFSAQSRHGFLPSDGLQFVPKGHVPKHVIFAEQFSGKHVCIELDEGIESALSERPYYDAGPNSKRLEPGDVLKINDVSPELSNVNLTREDGSSVGFGKIRTCFLSSAKLTTWARLPLSMTN